MLLSCEVAGQQTNCSSLFTRVPTDSGMCCALNWKNTLRNSEYKELVESMQGSIVDKKMPSHSGEKSGLRLILDLHSNKVSFGTLDKDYDAFKVFIGQPEEFPLVRQRSLKVQPGLEHFVELNAQVILNIFFSPLVLHSGDNVRGYQDCCAQRQELLLRG